MPSTFLQESRRTKIRDLKKCRFSETWRHQVFSIVVTTPPSRPCAPHSSSGKMSRTARRHSINFPLPTVRRLAPVFDHDRKVFPVVFGRHSAAHRSTSSEPPRALRSASYSSVPNRQAPRQSQRMSARTRRWKSRSVRLMGCRQKGGSSLEASAPRLLARQYTIPERL